MSDQLFCGRPEERSSGWDTLGSPVDPFHSYQSFKFLYYSPKCTGQFHSVDREELIISHAFEGLHLLSPTTENQRCLEACILLLAYFSMYEENTMKITINSKDDLTNLDIFGHKYHVLMSELEKVLCRRLFNQLQAQVMKMIKVTARHQRPDPDVQLQNVSTCKESYQNYIDFRNDDGLWVGVFYLVLSIMNESGEDASDALVDQVVEASILIHDTNNVIRHFMENDVANMYHYVDGDLRSSMSTAYKKAAGLYYQIRVDPLIKSQIKIAACSFISGIYAFHTAMARYGYGAQIIEMTSRCVGKITTLPGVYVIKHDRDTIIEDIASTVERKEIGSCTKRAE